MERTAVSLFLVARPGQKTARPRWSGASETSGMPTFSKKIAVRTPTTITPASTPEAMKTAPVFAPVGNATTAIRALMGMVSNRNHGRVAQAASRITATAGTTVARREERDERGHGHAERAEWMDPAAEGGQHPADDERPATTCASGRAVSRMVCVWSPSPSDCPTPPVTTDTAVGSDIHDRTTPPVVTVWIQPKPRPVIRPITAITATSTAVWKPPTMRARSPTGVICATTARWARAGARAGWRPSAGPVPGRRSPSRATM